MKETKIIPNRVTVTAKIASGEYQGRTYELVGEGFDYDRDVNNFEMEIEPGEWLVAHNDGFTWEVYLAVGGTIIEYLQVISVFIEYDVEVDS
jgi:hypothetical protein